LFTGWADNAWILLAFLVAAMVMKVVATSLTIGGGGSGGIFAPSIFVGGFMGFCLARLVNLSFVPLNISETNFALVGMAGIISGVMHAPLTAIFLILEITNSYELIIPLMIVSAIAYATIRYFEPHSIYASQLARKGHLIIHDKDSEVLTRMKLERVMETDLVTIAPDASLQELIDKIPTTKRNIFPVINENGHLMGIITLDDIREIMFRREMYENVKVSQLMRPAPAVVSREESMADVMKKFDETGAWNLPVIEDGKYVGFLSKSKIFSIYRRLLIEQSKE
jgi:CIC family chloride channel protein